MKVLQKVKVQGQVFDASYHTPEPPMTPAQKEKKFMELIEREVQFAKDVFSGKITKSPQRMPHISEVFCHQCIKTEKDPEKWKHQAKKDYCHNHYKELFICKTCGNDENDGYWD